MLGGQPLRPLQHQGEDPGVSPHGAGARPSAMQAALETAGVVFIPENGGGAGVRLRAPGDGR